jgi:hypothetical protein
LREDALTTQAKTVDEAVLINLRYALADALEQCRGISADSRSGSVAIEATINSAASQVMSLLRLQEAAMVALAGPGRLSSAA